VAGEQRTAHFQAGFAILDRRDGQTLGLELYHRYVIREAEGEHGPWTASTAEYVYEVKDQRDDKIAAWHWHPTTIRTTDQAHWPHVHAYGDREGLTLHKLHLVTGRISLEALVHFLVDDLNVVPRRDDWREIVERGEEAFRQARTWA
jgi:hypothetical protein